MSRHKVDRIQDHLYITQPLVHAVYNRLPILSAEVGGRDVTHSNSIQAFLYDPGFSNWEVFLENGIYTAYPTTIASEETSS